MQLFCCDVCRCVDAVELAYPDGPPHPSIPNAWQCTRCQTGEWHGQFELVPYNPERDVVVNRPSGIGLGT